MILLEEKDFIMVSIHICIDTFILIMNVESSMLPCSESSRSIQFDMLNECDDVILSSGIYHVFNGHLNSQFKSSIYPKNEVPIKLEASNIDTQVVGGCLVYKLINTREEHITSKQGYHVYLALEAFNTPSIEQNGVVAVLFMMKDGSFSGERNQIKWLHRDILQHYIKQEDHISGWLLNDRMIALDVKFINDDHIKIIIRRNNHVEEHRDPPIYQVK
jgi:hypothetical protein